MSHHTLHQSVADAVRDEKPISGVEQNSPSLTAILNSIDPEKPEKALQQIDDMTRRIEDGSISAQEAFDAKMAIDAIIKRIVEHIPQSSGMWRKLCVMASGGEALIKYRNQQSAEYRKSVLENALNASVETSAAEVNPKYKQLITKRDTLQAASEKATEALGHIDAAIDEADQAELMETNDLFSGSAPASVFSLFARDSLGEKLHVAETHYRALRQTSQTSSRKPHSADAKGDLTVVGKRSDIALNMVDHTGLTSIMELDNIDKVRARLHQMRKEVSAIAESARKGYEQSVTEVKAATAEIRKRIGI